jgi:hypothetical protein
MKKMEKPGQIQNYKKQQLISKEKRSAQLEPFS